MSWCLPMWTVPAMGSKLHHTRESSVKKEKKKEGQHTRNLTWDLTHTPGETCFHLGEPSSIFLTVQTQSMHMKVIWQTRWQVFPPVPGISVASSHLRGIWFLLALKIPTNKEIFGLIYEPGWRILSGHGAKNRPGFNSKTIFALPPSRLHRSHQSWGHRLWNDVINHALSNCHFQVICGAS